MKDKIAALQLVIKDWLEQQKAINIKPAIFNPCYTDHFLLIACCMKFRNRRKHFKLKSITGMHIRKCGDYLRS